MSPLSAVGCCRTTTQSPSQIRRFDHGVATDLEREHSAFTDQLPREREDILDAFLGQDRSAGCDAGPRPEREPAPGRHPQCPYRPRHWFAARARAAGSPSDPRWASSTSSARGRLGSRRRNPFASSILSWCATLDEDARINRVTHLSDAGWIAAPLDGRLDHFQDSALSKRQSLGVRGAIRE